MTKKVQRLFDQFQPRHYIVDLALNTNPMTFSGSVIISGRKVNRPSKRLVFHQKDLTITSAHVVYHSKTGDHKQPVARINHQRQYDEVRIHSSDILYPGNYTVTLHFKGRITKVMNGIYPCFFTHQESNKHLIATQFESHHAREAFPHIDEPQAKATFDLILTTPNKHTVIANTPIASQKANKNQLVTTFETTPHMSSYLLAFAFGDLKFLEAKTKHGVQVRTYATPDNVNFTKFALDAAIKCLEFYTDYFDIDYPLPKCDLIALPDFASGAMENWGCITFREQTMLVDPSNSTLANTQYVAMVVAHELAHQWFGNLVTMEWWTDLWLNEGFASWIEYLAVDKLFPKWQMWTQFVVDEQQQALKLDALEHTHPIEVPVKHPDEIRTIFDTISYSKGASVIHMLHNYLGANVFRDGLRYYLKKHAYNNTVTLDLWNALEEVSGKPVKDFMNAWTTQPGFPLISAEINDNDITISQQRFFINPKHTKLPQLTWPVALQATHTELLDVLNSASIKTTIKDSGHLKLNQGQSGFYRVAYNATHLEQLGSQIKKGHIDPLDRLGILSDVFETAKAGHTDTAEALHLLTYFLDEDNYAVWDVISSAIGSVRLVMGDNGTREQMKPFIRRLIKKQTERLGWNAKKQDSHFDKLLRPIVFGLAASADDPKIAKISQSLFSQSRTKSTENKIDPDMRSIVYCTVARLGGKTEFDQLLRLHNSSTLSEERNTLAAALGSFKQPELVDRSLQLISSSHVRLQDATYWIAHNLFNRHARLQTWQWIQDNWSWLSKNLGTDLSFYRMPLYVARVFSDPDFAKEYRAFFSQHLSPAFERPYKQGLEILAWQAAWKKHDQKEVKKFFELTK